MRFSAETLSRELARKLDMPPDNLEKNANMYNRYCAEGKDPDFGHSRENLIPLDTPPYYAMRLWPGGPIHRVALEEMQNAK